MTDFVTKPSEHLFAALARAPTGCPATVLFASADPITVDEREGFGQRVIAIDRVLAAGVRIYVKFANARRGAPCVTGYGQNNFVMELADCDPVSKALLETVLDHQANIYVHGIHSLAVIVGDLLRKGKCRCVIDLHGAAPEERSLDGDHLAAQAFNDLEREFYARADHVVCVSQKMVEHLDAKHGRARNPPIVLPVVTVSPAVRLDRRAYRERPKVTYAGGIHKWQQIAKLADAVAATKDRYDFVILTPAVSDMIMSLRTAGIDPGAAGMTVKAVDHDEAVAHCVQSDFGIVLRDDSIVNRIACPTKLVEYLACGAVPVMDSPRVGDFVDLGMEFVALDDFIKGKVPSVSERRSIAQRNRTVYDELARQYERGTRSLQAVLRGNGGGT